ncbi:MAG: hypothetical protein KKE29_12825 [Proteobacteria bacterium]|nr:hypothetical protein [Pseudomonadota bacterium]MBU4599083.1 hypothetical protein [Pseudomonadota bacterium]MBV1714864.1 hypothetical protein [Desulfarculus sp.]
MSDELKSLAEGTAKGAAEGIMAGIKNWFSRGNGGNKKIRTQDPTAGLDVDFNAIEVVRILNKAVCVNQAHLIQYIVLAGALHKKLKDRMREEPEDLSGLTNRLGALYDFLNRNLGLAAQRNFRFLHDYYLARSPKPPWPRICLKLPDENQPGRANMLADVFRDSDVGYNSIYPVEENTGHVEVMRDGQFFLCSDIPSLAKEGRYKNPRLDPHRVEEYGPQNEEELSESIDKYGYARDLAWERCWRPSGGGDGPARVDAPLESCYKSTLIIPMTLKSHDKDLSGDFKEIMGLEDKSRNIFGYLCFDHLAGGYFNNDPDVAVGYVVADILSLYYMTQLNYTKRSTTYQRSIELCGDPLETET